MLSYQHIYHAGNLIDVHKHLVLSNLLQVMLQKPKPFCYLETHAGRGLYNLDSPEANKTKEYIYGINQVDTTYNNIYFNVIKQVNLQFGSNIYAGSAAIAKTLLPQGYPMHLCELHSNEYNHLQQNITGKNINTYNVNGLNKILQISPPLLKRGVVFIDPSYEVKTEYTDIINFVKQLHKKWQVAVIALWYPVIESKENENFIKVLENIGFNKKLISQINFSALKSLKIAENNRIVGSKMLIINTPYGLNNINTIVKKVIN